MGVSTQWKIADHLTVETTSYLRFSSLSSSFRRQNPQLFDSSGKCSVQVGFSPFLMRRRRCIRPTPDAATIMGSLISILNGDPWRQTPAPPLFPLPLVPIRLTTEAPPPRKRYLWTCFAYLFTVVLLELAWSFCCWIMGLGLISGDFFFLCRFCIIEGPETVQDFAKMELQEIQDNIKSRRNKIFLQMEEVSIFQYEQAVYH